MESVITIFDTAGETPGLTNLHKDLFALNQRERVMLDSFETNHGSGVLAYRVE